MFGHVVGTYLANSFSLSTKHKVALLEQFNNATKELDCGVGLVVVAKLVNKKYYLPPISLTFFRWLTLEQFN